MGKSPCRDLAEALLVDPLPQRRAKPVGLEYLIHSISRRQEIASNTAVHRGNVCFPPLRTYGPNVSFRPTADDRTSSDKDHEENQPVQKHLALLRGINVGGHRKVPMAELRAIAEAAGFTGAKSYVASGNLIVGSNHSSSTIERILEEAIKDHFGFQVDVIVRSQQQWLLYAQGNPFAVESKVSPSLVMICVGKEAATDADLTTLQAKAGKNERVMRRHDVLWLYFGDGSARSKLGSGSSKAIWTTRNWTTVERLRELLAVSG